VKFSFEHRSQVIPVELTSSGKSYRLVIGDKTVHVEVLSANDGNVELLVDGKHITAYVSSDSARRWVTIQGHTFVLTKSSGARKGGHAGHHAAGELTAPMPGQVRLVNVREGESVSKGQTLMVLEAMKMEIRIHAPFDGRVTSIAAEVGQTVERDQMLLSIEGQT
jgi:biotin carboxyl carrier protein